MEVLRDAIRMGRAEAKADYIKHETENRQDAIRMGRAEAKLADWVAVAQDRGCNPHGTC